MVTVTGKEASWDLSFSNSDVSMSTKARWHPLFAKAKESAFPIPFAAPVIRAVSGLNFSTLFFHFNKFESFCIAVGCQQKKIGSVAEVVNFHGDGFFRLNCLAK